MTHALNNYFWNNGLWLALSAYALLLLLIWFVMGLDFRRNRELYWVLFLAALAIFPFALGVEITPLQVKSAIRNVFAVTGKANKSLNGFDILNVTIALVALFIALVPFLIEKIIRESKKDLTQELNIPLSQIDEALKQIIETRLSSLNAKCYGYFLRLMNDRFISRRLQTSSLQRIVEFYEIDFNNEEELLLQLTLLNATDAKMMMRLPESQRYLKELQTYYSEVKNNPDIVRECRRLLSLS